jgi:hypothetical protein
MTRKHPHELRQEVVEHSEQCFDLGIRARAQARYLALTLTELADYYKSDKDTIKHRYCETYELYLSSLKNRPINLLEIGVGSGCSLKMWHDYFRSASILGIDIRPECGQLCKAYPRVSIIIGNATKMSVECPFDIIIDDGSHISLDIVETFLLHWRCLRPGGFYVIEDLRPTYDDWIWPHFPHYPKERFSRSHFLAMLDDLMKEVDLRDRREIAFLHYYPELLFIRKSNESSAQPAAG